jgi:hypothetical protein
LEKRLEEVFQTILESALAGEINAEEKAKEDSTDNGGIQTRR